MDIAMVIIERFKQHKKAIWIVIMISVIAFIATKPHAFIDLWLTKDQQGQLLFNNGHYQQASKTFTNTHWQAYSAYGNEDYKTAAMLYSQFNDKYSLLSQANALAHAREYVKARNLYKTILQKYPNFVAAKTNQTLVQSIIDEINRLSQSQKAEQGESIKELGDEPQTADGADKKVFKPKELEQFNSEQLLQDQNLNTMWLRQVQKDPARFLSQKFYFQHSNENKSDSNEQ